VIFCRVALAAPAVVIAVMITEVVMMMVIIMRVPMPMVMVMVIVVITSKKKEHIPHVSFFSSQRREIKTTRSISDGFARWRWGVEVLKA